MAESSMFWTTNNTGDGPSTGYTQTQMFEFIAALMVGITGADRGGVLPDWLNKLEVTFSGGNAHINTGAGIVYGIPYFNSANVDIAVATPATSTRIDRIVLRASWAAQTVRLAKLTGSEGGGAPALTQSAGTTWEISLATISITTGGVGTVTDTREYAMVVPDAGITAVKLAPGAIPEQGIQDNSVTTNKIANLNVTTAKIADDAITFAKLQNLNTDRLLGRDTAGAGNAEEIALDGSLEFTGGLVLRRAALTGAITASAGSNATSYSNGNLRYNHMQQGYFFPTVIFRVGANQDFTTVVTADFDTVVLDYDTPNLIVGASNGEITLSGAATMTRFVASGYVGHASGSSDAWCNVYFEVFTGAAWVAQGATGRVFYVPPANWNAFSVESFRSFASGEKLRLRIERAAGSDMLRLSADSSLIVQVVA